MPRRTPNFERILASAQKLILAKGFPATTIDEVCDAAGVTKGGFYYHFKSKDQLALALVDHHFDRLVGALGEGDSLSHEDPLTRVLGFVDQAVEVARGPVLRDGCILGILALDLSETHPEIRAAVAERFSQLASTLAAKFSEVLEEQPRLEPVQAEVLARQFLATLEGSIILAKAHENPELVSESLGFYRMSLEAILSPRE